MLAYEDLVHAEDGEVDAFLTLQPMAPTPENNKIKLVSNSKEETSETSASNSNTTLVVKHGDTELTIKFDTK
jgi:hypothetical protein